MSGLFFFVATCYQSVENGECKIFFVTDKSPRWERCDIDVEVEWSGSEYEEFFDDFDDGEAGYDYEDYIEDYDEVESDEY